MPTVEELEKRCSALERMARDIVIGAIILALAGAMFLGYTWKSIPEKVSESLQGTSAKEAERQAKATAEMAFAQSEIAMKLVNSIAEHDKEAKQVVAELKAQPRFMWKKENNGTVSCDTYCGDSKWEGFAGTCVSAAINVNDSASCRVAYGGPTHCLCSAR
jgi:hypothetical protein